MKTRIDLFFLFHIAGLLFWANLSSAQDLVVPLSGKQAYSKLIKTQHEYKEAIARQAPPLEIAELCYLLGKRYSGINNYYKAKHWYLQSLKIREPFGPSEDIGKVYSRMYENEIYRNNEKQALIYSKLALLNLSQQSSLRSKMMVYRMHSTVFEYESKFDSATYYLEKSMRIAKQLGSSIDIALSFQFLAANCSKKNNLGKSIEYQKMAIEWYRKDKNFHNIVALSLNIGSTFLADNKPVLAKTWLNRAQTLADSLNDLNLGEMAMMESYHMAYSQKMGDWKDAFEHQRKSFEYKNRQIEINQEGADQGMSFLYENEKKEAQLEAQRKELKFTEKQRTTQLWLTAVTALLLFLAGVASLFYYRLFRRFKTISEVNALLVKEQSHRVKNNLQSVSDLMGLHLLRLSDPATIQVMEESLSRVETISLIHRNLYSKEFLNAIDLKSFIPDLIKNVLRTYHYSSVKAIYEIDDFQLHVDKTIPMGLIINELVTNSCKYAFKNISSPVLKIVFSVNRGKASLTFIDNGPGFIPDSLKNTFGLRIIDLLTKKLNGNQMFSISNGSHFQLSFNAGL